MKQFLKHLIGVIVACAVLLGIALVLYTASSYFASILSSKKASVNTEDTKKSVSIVLDAGHGGMDGGAVGVNGVLEKDLNLMIVLKTKALLEEHGYTVILTREEDVLLTDDKGGTKKGQDLRKRVAITEGTENPLLISVHMNRFPDSSVRGMTFYYSSNHPHSYDLAQALHSAMLATVQPDNRRPMKEATSHIYLLYHTTVPAVLIECGFVSNPIEEAMLCDVAYQNRIAQMITDGVIAFVEERKTE